MLTCSTCSSKRAGYHAALDCDHAVCRCWSSKVEGSDGPTRASGECLRPSLVSRTNLHMAQPNTNMKITSLLPALSALMFTVSAAAQSDPSVGGSFAPPPHSAGSVSTPTEKAGLDSTDSADVPHHVSFWDRLTGRDSKNHQSSDRRADHSQGWFKRNAAPDKNSTDHRMGWFHQQTPPQSSGSHPGKESTGSRLPFFRR